MQKIDKMGNWVCPVCGGEVVQTESNIGAKITGQRNPHYEAEWNCIKCGSRFYAEMKGLDVTFKSIDIERQFGYGVNILGNAESGYRSNVRF